MSDLTKTLLDFKIQQMSQKLLDDMDAAIGSREEQVARLERLIEMSAYPTKDAVFVKCWGDRK